MIRYIGWLLLAIWSGSPLLAQEARQVRDINPGSAPSDPGGPFEVSGNTLYFSANTGTGGAVGIDLWQSNGEAFGTRITLDSQGSQNPEFLTDVDGVLYFAATELNTGRELWRVVNGVPSIVANIRSGNLSSSPAGITNVNGRAYFVASTDNFGRELHRTTATGVERVSDILPNDLSATFSTGNTVPNMVALNDRLFFVADDGQTGRELWRTDGTVGSTVRLSDLNPGSASTLFFRRDPDAGDRVENLIAAGNQVFFSGILAGGASFLGVSDGTEAGTRVVREFGGEPVDDFAVLNNELIFSAGELWKSDGTTAGTTQIIDIDPFGSSFPTWLTTVGDYVYFSVLTGSGEAVWRTDGTAGGTIELAPVGIGKPVGLDGVAYFSAVDPDFGQELWRSDGTPQGTWRLTDIAPGQGDAVANQLAAVDGQVFMSADDGQSGNELWAIRVSGSASTESSANFELSGSTGDPVNTFTGELFESPAPDFDLGGPLPLIFSRYYASGLAADGVAGTLGRNWRHSFEWTFVPSPGAMEIVDPRGRRIQFLEESGSFDLVGVSVDVPYVLIAEGANHILGDPVRRLLFVFNASGQLAQIQDQHGNQLTLTYNAGGELQSVTDGLGRELTFTYFGSGLLSSVQDDNGREISFSYTGEDQTTFTDISGEDYLLAYDPGGLLVSRTFPLSNVPLSQTWDNAQVVNQRDALGNDLALAYTPGETRITRPDLSAQSHRHDGSGRLTGMTNAAGEEVAFVSDGSGRRAGVMDRVGNDTLFQYSPEGADLEQITRADGEVLTYTHGSFVVRGVTFQALTGVNYPDGTSVGFGRSASGALDSITDQSNELWTYTRNAAGQILTVTNPLGGVTTQTYNPDGTLATRTDAGNLVSFGYDAVRRMNRVTYPGGAEVRLTYDAADRLTSLIDARGNNTQYAYDANGRLTTVTDRAGEVKRFGYDNNNRLTSVELPGGQVASVTYDENGRLRGLADNLSRDFQLAYNPIDELVGVSDATGSIVSLDYDTEGGLVGASNAEGDAVAVGLSPTGVPNSSSLSTQTLDRNGRATAQQMPGGREIRREFDARGRVNDSTFGAVQASRQIDALGGVTTETDPAGNDATHVFDNHGRVMSSTDRLGQTTTYTYDNRGRVDQVTFPGGMGDVTLTYDNNNNLTRALYSDGTDLSATYDAMDRLTSGSGISLDYDADGQIVQSNGLTLTRRTDGQIASVTYPSGMQVTYTYNNRGLLQTVSDDAGNSASFSYDQAGRRARIDRSNGVRTEYDYDGQGRLSRLAVIGGVSNKAPGSRRKGGTQHLTNLMRYFQDGMLAGIDREENIEPDIDALQALDFSYNAGNQITLKTYDPLGRVTQAENKEFDWDLAGRLTRITEDAVTVDLSYDVFGRFTGRTTTSLNLNFRWNYGTGEPSLAVETESGTDRYNWIATPEGELLWRYGIATGMPRFVHYDALGNAAVTTDENGVAWDHARFDPYGQLLAGAPLMPLGPWASLGALSITEDIIQDQPGGYVHGGAKARIAPLTNGEFFATNLNDYEFGAGGNPVWVDDQGSGFAASLDAIIRETLRTGIFPDGIDVAPDTAVGTKPDLSLGIQLGFTNRLPVKAAPPEVCMANQRASIEKEIERIKKRLDELEQQARQLTQEFIRTLGESPLPFYFSPEAFIADALFNDRTGALRSLLNLRETGAAVTRLRELEAQLKELDSIVPELPPLVIIC